MTTHREASKSSWTAAVSGSTTLDEINTGSFQRIADATELMAKRYSELIAERDSAIRSKEFWQERTNEHIRTISNLRGQITKLRNQLAAKAKPE